MKKTYITPKLMLKLVRTERMMALSLQGDKKANSSDALSKGDEWSNIWNSSEE